jgi:mono/diheme cytochrome c family protein
MKQLFILTASVLALTSCGGGDKTKDASASNEQTPRSMVESSSNENPSYDPNRGEGKFTTVALGEKLDATMAASGDKIQGVKCAACHKLTDEKLVGPGWKGVTERRKPEWIMNFITNPDPMIDKDPAVQAQYELCLVRMPNQGLTDDDARHILEFMRQNDGVK